MPVSGSCRAACASILPGSWVGCATYKYQDAFDGRNHTWNMSNISFGLADFFLN